MVGWDLEGVILMRIPDYRNVHGVRNLNHWRIKKSLVNKVHKDEFGNDWKTPFIKEKESLERDT